MQRTRHPRLWANREPDPSVIHQAANDAAELHLHPRDHLWLMPERLRRLLYLKCQLATRWVASFCRCGGFVAANFGRVRWVSATRIKKAPEKSGAASLGGNRGTAARQAPKSLTRVGLRGRSGGGRRCAA